MNKYNAAQYLPLVQALAEGKTLQIRSSPGKWVNVVDTRWGAAPEFYRVKPEPAKLYAVLRKDGTYLQTYRAKEEAVADCKALNESGSGEYKPYRVAKMIEQEDNNGNC